MSLIFGFVIVLGVLIFFHELGHFLCAKAFGVGVEKFSLGFGPKIAAKTIGRTEYRLSAIPLGGYVKMVGEQPDAEIDPADIPFSFTHKNVFQRMLIVASGPVFNFVLAVLIFFGIFSFAGIMILQPIVGEVKTGSPAESAGFLQNDKILQIDKSPVESWSQMAERIMESHGAELDFVVERSGSELELRVRPGKETAPNIFGEDKERYVIGVTASGETVSKTLNPVEAFVESIRRTYEIAELTVVSVVKLIEGVIPADTIGGPILIAQVAGEQAAEGFLNLLFFIAIVSINLGILNLLPVPVLDGGHILFFLIEAVFRRPLSIRTREIAQQIGIFLLMMLMVFAFYNDIMRLFTGRVE
ncbi:MAG: RIP metalloprotease RseP [Desulfobacterales bacterium]|nr:RIP metalloprotease RseP [Desulfobacterales bacterium]